MNHKFFLLKGISLNNWCQKWNLSPSTARCSQCQTILDINLPFVYEDIKGLTSKCDCGNTNTPFVESSDSPILSPEQDLAISEAKLESLLAGRGKCPRLKKLAEAAFSQAHIESLLKDLDHSDTEEPI